MVPHKSPPWHVHPPWPFGVLNELPFHAIAFTVKCQSLLRWPAMPTLLSAWDWLPPG